MEPILRLECHCENILLVEKDVLREVEFCYSLFHKQVSQVFRKITFAVVSVQLLEIDS